MSSAILKTSLLCLVSAILCALLNVASCASSSDAACPIGALQFLAWPDIRFAVWFNWVNWVPGLVFGALFSLSAIAWQQPGQASRGVGFILLSGLIYLLAGPLFTLVLVGASPLHSERILNWLLPDGLITGLFGSFALSASARLLLRPADDSRSTAAWLGITALIGAVAGLAFVATARSASDSLAASWSLAFAVWQIPVGLALKRQIA